MNMNELKLSSKENKNKTTFTVGDVVIGKDFVVIAGPCSVETEEQTLKTAQAVKSSGANILRGGAFKPRTSPYSFQGLGEDGLKILKIAKDLTGLPIITEVLDPRDLQLVSDYADILQVGSRNMHNAPLLEEVGRSDKPVMIKRGMQATYLEWLNSAEYVLNQGNPNVILCERGIRTFETHVRNTLDLTAVPVMQQLTHLPIFVDPSHATGKFEYVPAMSLAAKACGADGIMVEVHPNPKDALSDKNQALTPKQFHELMTRLKRL